MEGPILYQLLFSTSGTPGALAKFDTNPRHLINSLLKDNGSMVAIGGMSINSAGIISFAGGQTFPGGGGGTVTSVTATTGLTGGTITTSGQIALDTNYTDSRYAAASSLASYLALSGGTMSGPLQLSGPPTIATQAATKGYVDAQALPDSLGVLAADYEFDETSGSTFADSSGYNHTAIGPSGGFAAGAAGHTGKAITFAGGLVKAIGVPDSPQIWVEAWVSPSALTGTQTILTKPGVYELRLQSGALVFYVTGANGTCSAQSAGLPPSQFSHAGGWYNGLTVVVELNGKTTEVPCPMGPLGPSAALFMGAGDGSGSNPFNGTIDEVRIRTVAPPVQVTATNQFCGSSPSSSGSFAFNSSTGYRAAALICQQACGSQAANMCSAPDMVRSAELGLTLPGGLWYSSGTSTPGPGSTTINDCNGWTSSQNTNSGPAWSSGAPATVVCTASLPIACCSLR